MYDMYIPATPTFVKLFDDFLGYDYTKASYPKETVF